ncbi:unnamed protein product [Clavelina lepadiformis]|uniref:Serpin domain-containing protein n=1 Tax=Clavelina lepadiformis TaxID=159417 RepID=A0ABP0F0X1_CLALP
MKLLIIAILCAVACSGRAQDENDKEWKKQFTRRLLTFSNNLHAQFTYLGAQENIIFSPVSLYEALGMLLAGAEETTEKQLLRGMQLEPLVFHDRVKRLMSKLHSNAVTRSDEAVIRMANAMFLQHNYDLFPEFNKTIVEDYQALVDLVDFGDALNAVERINGWVESKTENRIQDLVTPGMITTLTRMVLVNAVYFKANWKTQFSPMNEPLEFTLSSGERTETSGMRSLSAIKVHLHESDNGDESYIAIEYDSPYTKREDDNKKIYFIVGMSKHNLPAPKRMPDNVLELGCENDKSRRDKSWRRSSVLLTLPKFSMTQRYDMKSVLNNLGIRNIFDAGTSELSLISPAEKNLYVSDFVHKAFIKVNEEGSEAAAASAIVVSGRSAGPRSITVDKPFIYGIYSARAKAFLFMGKIERPEYEVDE